MRHDAGTGSSSAVTDDIVDGTDRTADLGALEALYRDRYAPSVRLAHLMIGNRARAEELAQDAFVRVLPKIGTVDNPAGFLRTVLVNLCRDEGRHRAVVARHPQRPPDHAPPPGLPAATSAVWLALQELPANQRDALALRFYADAPTDEIAKLLGVRPATVRSLVHRGLTTLKEVVDRD
ncbi:MAG: sigma-70 family RNA polymerase sigma factor [Aquihabitans sp.]